jgi:peptide/nickel transport system substrate-binding protein
VEVKLVPNPSYWAAKPNLDGVVFKFITDTGAYLAAYKTGQVDMVFVQGAQPDVAELKNVPDTRFEVNQGLTYEFLMFNTLRPPLDSPAVRQALAYATDRDAIVGQISNELRPGTKASQAFMSPGNEHWYSEPFKKYQRDLPKVTQLMTGAGWARGADGIWAKAGARAVIELNALAGNRRRELAEQILQSQWKDAGFEATVNNTTVTGFQGEMLPKGTFGVALFGIAPASSDPNQCGNFCSRFTPTEANGFTGGNFSRIASPAIDETWQATAAELDDAKRVERVRQAQQALADELPALPLTPGLDIVIYNSAKIGGLKLNPVGAFYNLSEWFCRPSSCRR